MRKYLTLLLMGLLPAGSAFAHGMSEADQIRAALLVVQNRHFRIRSPRRKQISHTSSRHLYALCLHLHRTCSSSSTTSGGGGKYLGTRALQQRVRAWRDV